MNKFRMSQRSGVTGAPQGTQGRALRRAIFADIVRRMNVYLSRCVVVVGILLPAVLLGAAAARAQSAGGPIDTLHQAQGGAIAQPRPEMPGADQPYPNLSTVPPKPKPVDESARAAVSQRLVADRANAQYETKVDPLPPVKAAPPQPTNNDDLFGASLSASSASPSASRPVPTSRPVAVAQAPAKPSTKPTAPAASAQPSATPTPAAPIESLPPMASAPPRPAAVAGPAATAPTPPPVAPAAVEPITPAPVAHPIDPADKNVIAIGFAPSSDQLDGDALAKLKAFVRTRGNHTIEVTGFGDIDSDDAAAQTAGLQLALGRARAIAGYLTGVGLPPSALRVTAEAQGHGAAARLTD